ncbi:MAG: GNAT family N-acetyltransferase [Blastocatellia bacterium]
MAIQLRLAVMEEVPALEQLIAASVRGLSEGYYTAAQIESALVHVFGVDTQLITDGTYFVAELAGQPVGCGGWSRRKTLFGGDQTKTAEDNLLNPQTEPARIRAFFVHPDFARRGIGRQIIEACEQAAQAAGFRQLELAATLPGEPLYRAVGYDAIERWEHQLADGVVLPLVRMGKSFA